MYDCIIMFEYNVHVLLVYILIKVVLHAHTGTYVFVANFVQEYTLIIFTFRI